MHVSQIPPSVFERVHAARGGAHLLGIDPARTALLIIDLQIGFMAPGAPSEISAARDIVANVNRISAAARSSGAQNAFVRFTVDFEEPRYWGSMFERMTAPARDALLGVFKAGAPQHALWPGLELGCDDWIVDKTRFSAFIPGTCDLEERLRARGVDTLIVTGAASNCCCESTARDAMQMGYRVLFVQDGNATFDDASHNATLANMAGLFFADVVTTDQAVALLLDGPRGAAGAGNPGREA
jgi:nicotinamidase-related amidase